MMRTVELSLTFVRFNKYFALELREVGANRSSRETLLKSSFSLSVEAGLWQHLGPLLCPANLAQVHWQLRVEAGASLASSVFVFLLSRIAVLSRKA